MDSRYSNVRLRSIYIIVSTLQLICIQYIKKHPKFLEAKKPNRRKGGQFIQVSAISCKSNYKIFCT